MGAAGTGAAGVIWGGGGTDTGAVGVSLGPAGLVQASIATVIAARRLGYVILSP